MTNNTILQAAIYEQDAYKPNGIEEEIQCYLMNLETIEDARHLLNIYNSHAKKLHRKQLTLPELYDDAGLDINEYLPEIIKVDNIYANIDDYYLTHEQFYEIITDYLESRTNQVIEIEIDQWPDHYNGGILSLKLPYGAEYTEDELREDIQSHINESECMFALLNINSIENGDYCDLETEEAYEILLRQYEIMGWYEHSLSDIMDSLYHYTQTEQGKETVMKLATFTILEGNHSIDNDLKEAVLA